MANLSIRRLYWPTQQTVTDWQPGLVNTAGSIDLATDGALVCGRAARNLSLIWTTSDLWTMTYIGGEFIYAFAQVGKNCGIIGQHAMVVLDANAFWMGAGRFFAYNGFVTPIPCDVTDYVFGNINTALGDLVFAVANPVYSEVTWHYPSQGSTACDRYVTYNYVEQHWVFGTLARSAGVTQQPGATSAVPVLIDATGAIYDHETGTSHGGATPFLESGPVELGDGDNVVRVQRIVPDDKTLGQVQIELYAALFPDAAETLSGPYTLAAQTPVRVTARQVRVRIQEAVASAWRVGVIRLGGIMGGRR